MYTLTIFFRCWKNVNKLPCHWQHVSVSPVSVRGRSRKLRTIYTCICLYCTWPVSLLDPHRWRETRSPIVHHCWYLSPNSMDSLGSRTAEVNAHTHTGDSVFPFSKTAGADLQKHQNNIWNKSLGLSLRFWQIHYLMVSHLNEMTLCFRLCYNCICLPWNTPILILLFTSSFLPMFNMRSLYWTLGDTSSSLRMWGSQKPQTEA